MENRPRNISELEAKQKINEIDFTKIINKMQMSTGWTKRQIVKSVELYRHFLFLKFKYGEEYKLPPSVDIDIVWQNHILGTHQYHEIVRPFSAVISITILILALTSIVYSRFKCSV